MGLLEPTASPGSRTLLPVDGEPRDDVAEFNFSCVTSVSYLKTVNFTKYSFDLLVYPYKLVGCLYSISVKNIKKKGREKRKKCDLWCL